MVKILPLLASEEVVIVHEVFGLGTIPDPAQVYPHLDTYDEMISWLRKRVNQLDLAIKSNEDWVIKNIKEIDVDKCNRDLDNGTLTLCGLTIEIKEID